MKDKILKQTQKSLWIVISIFYLIFLLINIGVKRQAGDDVVHLETLKQAGNIFSLLKNRYLGWTGRVFLEFVMYSLLNQNIVIWKVINSFMILLLGLGIYEFISVCSNKNNKYNNYLIIAVMMSIFMLPLGVFSTSITWITGSFNYLWPVALGMVSLVFIKKCLYNHQIKPVMFVLVILCSIFACNQEQVAAILIGFSLFAIIFCFVKYKKLDYKLLFIFCVIILFGSFSILSPGNKSRYWAEINTWYPGFNDLSLIQRSLQSLSFSLDRFVNIFSLENRQFNLLMMSISLMIFVICKNKKIISKISLLPIIYFLIRILFNPSFGYFIFDYDLKHLESINGVISLCLVTVVFAVMMISLYFCFDDIEEQLISVILFSGAILSSFVTGFSPTIFASGSRIFFCSFVLFIVIFGMLFSRVQTKFKDNTWFILSEVFCFAYLSLIILSYIVKWSGMLIYS